MMDTVRNESLRDRTEQLLRAEFDRLLPDLRARLLGEEEDLFSPEDGGFREVDPDEFWDRLGESPEILHADEYCGDRGPEASLTDPIPWNRVDLEVLSRSIARCLLTELSGALARSLGEDREED